LDLIPVLDKYSLATIPAPERIEQMTLDEAVDFGQQATALGLVIGESLLGRNLMAADLHRRAEHMQRARHRLALASAMGCRAVLTGVGAVDPSGLSRAPPPSMFPRDCRREFREVLLRIVDGVESANPKLLVEPTNRTFFYQPEDIADFLATVDHPA